MRPWKRISGAVRGGRRGGAGGRGLGQRGVEQREQRVLRRVARGAARRREELWGVSRRRSGYGHVGGRRSQWAMRMMPVAHAACVARMQTLCRTRARCRNHARCRNRRPPAERVSISLHTPRMCSGVGGPDGPEAASIASRRLSSGPASCGPAFEAASCATALHGCSIVKSSMRPSLDVYHVVNALCKCYTVPVVHGC